MLQTLRLITRTRCHWRHGLAFAGGCEPSSAAGRAISISKNAYARCGIHGRPKICTPGGTGMVVYSSGFLRQSFAHFKTRYEALCAWDIVLQGLAEDPSNKGRARHRKRRETIVRAGQRLARASHV